MAQLEVKHLHSIMKKSKGLHLFLVLQMSETILLTLMGIAIKKSIEAALRDLAKAVDKYDKGEGDAIRSMIKNKEIAQVLPDRNIGGAQYLLDWEEVPSASRYVDSKGIDASLSEEDDRHHEIEYADGRWYLHIRFLR